MSSRFRKAFAYCHQAGFIVIRGAVDEGKPDRFV